MPSPTRLSPVAQARAWMLLSGLCFTAMIATVRWAGHLLHPFEVVFFRNVFGFLVLVPVLLRSRGGVYRTGRFRMHLARSLCQTVFMLGNFYAVTLLPLADFTALGFTAPLFAGLAAIVVLGEPLDRGRLTALAGGFLGVLVVVRPGFATVSGGAMLTLAASCIWATCLLIIRSLGRTESSLTTTAWFATMMMFLTFGPALAVWRWPTPVELAVLAAIGAMGTCAHLTLAQALRQGEAGAVLPLDFMRLLWASAVGWAVFGQAPDAWSWLGGGLIFAAATSIAVRDARAKAAVAAAKA